MFDPVSAVYYYEIRGRRDSPRSLLLVPLEHPEVGRPGADGSSIRSGHRAGDLGDVREIVHDPGGEELSHCHSPELRMLARQLQVFFLEIPTAESRDVSGAKLVELGQQILEGAIGFQLGETVERIGTRV